MPRCSSFAWTTWFTRWTSIGYKKVYASHFIPMSTHMALGKLVEISTVHSRSWKVELKVHYIWFCCHHHQCCLCHHHHCGLLALLNVCFREKEFLFSKKNVLKWVEIIFQKPVKIINIFKYLGTFFCFDAWCDISFKLSGLSPKLKFLHSGHGRNIFYLTWAPMLKLN